MSLELVLLVPVLVLLTVFVLWAGRGGRAALTADLAAEEAATAAALCCEEDEAGAADREALVEDMLEARPGLGFLCIGGPRPNAGGGSDKFLSEHWLEFEPGRDTGGVGVLGVQFLCESDGAVAPLRGLFPTVTFHGQAAEVVVREPPPPDIGFEQSRFLATEGPGTPLLFTVDADTPVSQDVVVNYEINSATTAVPGVDYTELPGAVTIVAGHNSATITVSLLDDNLWEDAEFLALDLFSLTDTFGDPLPAGVAQLDADRLSAVGEITDDDPPPYLFVVAYNPDPPDVVEGNRQVFEVRLRDQDRPDPAPSAKEVTVDVATMDLTPESATSGDDYMAFAESLTFASGEVSKRVTVQTSDDLLAEDDEMFELVLQNAAGAKIGSGSETVTILDNEATVSVADAAADEGETLEFKLGVVWPTSAVVSTPLEVEVTYQLVAYMLAANDATQGSACGGDADYPLPSPATARIVYPATTATIQVQTCHDMLVEPDEQFWLELSTVTGAVAVPAHPENGAVGTIRNDDTPVITVDDETAWEAPLGGTLTFTVTVNLEVDGSPAVLTEDVTVQYDIVGHSGTDSATAIDDFRSPPPVPLPVPPPDPLDLLSGRLTFTAGGDTEIEVPVVLVDDYLLENSETFHLVLSSPSANAELFDRDPVNTIDEPYAVGTITDDPPPTLSVDDFSGLEGTTQSFTVTLANPRSSVETAEVVYAFAPGSPDPADAGDDYTAVLPADLNGGTLSFSGGVTVQSVTVDLVHDNYTERDEKLELQLSNAVQAHLPAGTAGVGTITNVIPPYLVVDDVSAHEGTDLVFTVTLCNPRAGDTVTVDYRTADREAAVQDGDFEHMSGTLVVGSTPDVDPSDVSSVCGDDGVSAKSHTVRVKTLTDLIAENDERLHLVLSENPDAALNAVLEDRVGVGTIINSNAPVVRVSNARAKEGEMLTFVISLVDVDDNAADYVEEVTVTYQTADRGSAEAGEDYEPVTATVTFPARGATTLGGFTTHDVDVELKNDTEDEDDEIFALVAAVPERNASLGKAEGTGTIVDRDPPALRIEDATAEEGDDLVFQVRLGIRDEYGTFVETPTSEAVSVLATTADGTATAPWDYTTRTQQRLEFMPGDTQIDFPVASIPDDDVELAETFWVELSGAQNARLDRADAKGTIGANCIDVADPDQDPPTITLHSGTMLEGEIQYLLLEFSRPLCPDPQRPNVASLVFERVLDSTATRADLSPISTLLGKLWLHAASTEAPGVGAVPTEPQADGLDEDDEYFTVQVGWAEPDRRQDFQNDDEFMPVHYYGTPWATAVVTIVDIDPLPGLTVSDADAVAGQPLTFEVVLNPQSGRTVTVEYRTVDGSGTATAGDDYTPLGWTRLEFAPGDTSLSFDVVTFPDSDTVDDTFLVEVRAPDPADPDYVASNVLIIDAVAVGTILEGGKPTLRIHDAQAEEAGDGDSDVDGTLIFSVELSAPAVAPVTVDYATVQRPEDVGAATEGVDYTRADGDLTFDVGDQFQTIAVQSLHDEEPEGNETFLVELSNPSSGVSLADPSAVGTIIDDEVQCVDPVRNTSDPMPYTLRGETVDEGAGRMSFTVVLPQALCRSNSLSYSAVGGTATADEDYEFVAGQRYIPAFVTEWKGFHVVLYDDDIDETNETILMRTGVAHAGFMRAAYATGTIIDNDDALLSVRNVEVGEGGAVSFGLSLDRPVGGDVTVDYATADVSAVADEDYQPLANTATIPAGQRSASVTVRTVEDLLDEHDETFELRLSNAQGVKLATDCSAGDCDVAVGTILDDDDPPAVRVSNPSGDEGAALVFAVTLDAPSGRAGSVTYSTRDGPTIGGATAGADYGSESGPLAFVAFAAGETAKTVSVQTLTDDEVEGSERFFLDLSSSDFGFDKDIGTGTIRDVTQRRVSVSDASVLEGGVLKFVADFNGPPASRDITVEYSTVADTAEAGVDYSDAVESSPRVLRILAGNTSAVVRVQTLLDTLDEDLEQLKLVLSDPVGAVLAAGEAVGTIIDDDPEPLLSVDDPEATENGDGTPITFTVSLSEESGRDVSVGYSTDDLTATADDDYVPYVPEPGQRLTIPAGHQTATIDVTLVDDDLEEGPERFHLVLSDPSNARSGDNIGAATIRDDDGLIEIILDTPDPVYEGPGATVDFVVRLSRPDPDAPVTFGNYMVAGSAAPFVDYTPVARVWTIDPGETSFTISVPLIDDDLDEETETFSLGIGGPTTSDNAFVSGVYHAATGTILDDDGLPKLSVADAPAATEGAAATFAVELSRQSTRPVTVEYAAVADPFGGDAAAIPGQDFEAVTGTLTIPARSTSATVAVPLPDDALDEHTETFWLRLADPTGATVDDGTGIGMIDDDDPLPQLSVGDSGATEGDPIRFTVTLTPASGRTVTVPWTTAVSLTGNPASPTGDFVAASGTLIFPTGTTTAYIEIGTTEDDVSELDETFQVRLGRPTNAAVDDGVAVGAILDDDGLPRISIAGDTVLETDSPAKFIVTLSRLSSQTVTVDYATTEVTATAATGIGKDYGPPSGEATGTLVIPAGLDTGEISVYVADDDIAEGTETFHVSLSNAVNAVIAEGAGTAVGTILDDDVTRIAIGDAYAHEADGTIEFPVTLSAASTDPVTVRYTTFDGSATQPDDYLAASTTLTIPAGTTTATIAVTLTDDTFVEDPESFLVRLSDPVDSEIATDEAVGVIFDDDDLPVISGLRTQILESDGSHTWRVMLSHPSNLEVTVDYRQPGWGGFCHGSSPAVEGTLVFEPGSTTATVTVTVIDDDVACIPIGGGTRIAHVVTNEYLYFSNPVNAVRDASGYVIVDVHDDDGKTTVRMQSLYSGALIASESDGQMVLYVELGRPLEVDVAVPIRIDETQALQSVLHPPVYDMLVSGPQATAGSDFVARNESVTVPAGEVLVQVLVQITDDDTVEETEFFAAVIGQTQHDYLIGGGTAGAQIIDNDSVNVAAEDIEVLESAGTAVFRLQLDRENTQTVTVDYETADGTAEQPEDYTQTSGTATFDAGTRTVLVRVPVVDDDEEDADETFDLRLTGASGASISDNSATATIRDDDGDDNLPVIHIADASATEPGYIGTSSTRACFAVTIRNYQPGVVPISVDYQSLEAPWLGDGAATPGADYGAFTYGEFEARTVEIYGAESEICATVFNDDIPEPDEMFIGWLSNPVGAVLGNNMAWATIIDRDPPIASVIDVEASESDAAVEFTLSLHAPDIEPSSVDYTTVVLTSEGDRAARPGEDYTTVSDTLTFPAGATSATISVPIIHDTDDEADETFELVLSNPVNLEFLDGVAIGTIVDDDPGWVIDDRSVREDAGSMVFTVIRDHTDTSAVTVDYTVTGASAVGGGDCADAGVDYITPSGSVTLLPAQTQAEISVTVCDDDVVEGSETLFIELTGVPGRKLTGIGTIFDNIGG